MPDIAQLITAHAERLKQIHAKKSAGKKLTPADIAFLETAAGTTKAGSPHDTIGSAASALGVSRSFLSKARKAGMPGCKGSRLELTRETLIWLVQWLYETGGISEAEAHTKAIAAETLKRKRFENDKLTGKYELKTDVDALLLTIAERIKGVLRSRLKNELPPKLEGLRAAEIAAVMDTVIPELIECLRAPVAMQAGGPAGLQACEGAA